MTSFCKLYNYEYADFSELVGKTFDRVFQKGEDEIFFLSKQGASYLLTHLQDCCEYVYVEDIVGPDINGLSDKKILSADESYNSGEEGRWESYTWSFYTIRTVEDTWTIRFYGSSNGYYSEAGQLLRLTGDFSGYFD